MPNDFIRSALKVRRIRDAGWDQVSDDDQRREGMIFRESWKTPGIKTAYGYTAHDPAWIAKRWAGLFQQISSRTDLIEKVQDLNVMIKARA